MLICARCDLPYVWQLPQGGIDGEETPEEALLRELKEEIGTNEVEIIAKFPHTIKYLFPDDLKSQKNKYFKAQYDGQEQIYFLVKLNDISKINIRTFFPQEFIDVDWVGADIFLNKVIGFKKDAYTKAVQYCLENYPNYLKH
jgi:putative (di)nucleoside polyphosphate hydrolase